MKKYIVLLRGINVSGKNKIPMVDLRRLLTALKFQKVQTYIQSGNIILEANLNRNDICDTIKIGIKEKFGFDVPVIAKTISEWKKAIANYPFAIENEKIVAFTFLDRTPEINEIEIKNIGEDQFKIDGDLIYVYCSNGFGKSKINNNIFEKKLKVTATTRNLRTTLKLLQIAEDEVL
ncbi:DUF1697 domain-containing protein [Polaribacter sp. R77954]|uniref:DUF1697 domain-containing protein n=1 Tax=Polaribacter sp. R77954 TaxID=3093870 RepID=UPI0037CA10AF